MSDDNTSNKIVAAAEVIKAAADALPIYEDLAQPAAKELGKSLHTVAKAVNVALAPISALVWGYEQIQDFVLSALEKRLKATPPSLIVTPDPTLAGPVLEALRFTGHKEDLRELFANLLATAMDKQTALTAHPAFTEILKQITSDEAKILRLITDEKSHPIIKVRAYDKVNHYSEPLINFSLLPYQAKCSALELGPTYLENIARFGLVEIEYSKYSTIHSYEPLETHPSVKTIIEAISLTDKRVEIMRGTICRTNFGKTFYDACIQEKNYKRG